MSCKARILAAIFFYGSAYGGAYRGGSAKLIAGNRFLREGLNDRDEWNRSLSPAAENKSKQILERRGEAIFNLDSQNGHSSPTERYYWSRTTTHKPTHLGDCFLETDVSRDGGFVLISKLR